MTLHDRVSRIEGVAEQMNECMGSIECTLNRIERRLNTMMQIMIGGFIAILVAVIGFYFTG